MTGGVGAILGEIGRNFAAGMSGGIAYVYDPEGRLGAHCNTASVELELIEPGADPDANLDDLLRFDAERLRHLRSEEHTSELQSLMRISYAVFCLKKKNKNARNKIK